MGVAKKMLYGVLGMLALLSMFILACVIWPGLSDTVSELMYADEAVSEEMTSTDTSEQLLGMNEAEGDGAEKIQGTGLTSQELLRTPQPPQGYEIHTSSAGRTDTAADTVSKWDRFKVPEGVSGKNGYVPVDGKSEQVSDEEAEKLQEEYTYGETGEGLDFDTQFYPYYGMLDTDGQTLYRQIYANANAVNGTFNPLVKVSVDELRNVFVAVFNDHPELFWLDSAYRGKFDRNGNCACVVLQFNYLVDDLNTAKNKFYTASEEILTGADRQISDYAVELYIHDALMNRIAYDKGASLNQSAYSALVNGKTVCAGYARAFQYLMTQMGIPCYYCTGNAGEKHAWNIVKLDGDYYNVDVTWNDTNPATYLFFNKTDADFDYTHTREELSVKLPACSGTKYGNLQTAPAGETDAVYAGARALEDAGFTREQVISSLEAYYEDCYQQLIENGASCQFQNAVKNENLWMKCYDAYMKDDYSAGYMDRVLTELGKQGCEIDIEAEALQDGTFILHHSINFF